MDSIGSRWGGCADTDDFTQVEGFLPLSVRVMTARLGA